MEERSLRIYNSERTFFSKITNTINKLLIPTKIGLNGMIISIKRNNVLKVFETLNSTNDQEKKEALTKKFDEIYSSNVLNILLYISCFSPSVILSANLIE